LFISKALNILLHVFGIGVKLKLTTI